MRIMWTPNKSAYLPARPYYSRIVGKPYLGITSCLPVIGPQSATSTGTLQAIRMESERRA
jgi:hypothetical protein